MVYRRKFKHPKEELLEEGKRIIATDRDTKFLFRVTMVNLVLGQTNRPPVEAVKRPKRKN